MSAHGESNMSAGMLGATRLQNLIRILKPMTNPNDVIKPSIKDPKAFKAIPIANKANQLIGYKIEPVVIMMI